MSEFVNDALVLPSSSVVPRRLIAELLTRARYRLRPPGAKVPTRIRIGPLQVDVLFELSCTPLLSARELAERLNRTDDAPVYAALNTLVKNGLLSAVVDHERSLYGSLLRVYSTTTLGNFELDISLIDAGDTNRLRQLTAYRALADRPQSETTSHDS